MFAGRIENLTEISRLPPSSVKAESPLKATEQVIFSSSVSTSLTDDI
jgi:hypothetical protein